MVQFGTKISKVYCYSVSEETCRNGGCADWEVAQLLLGQPSTSETLCTNAVTVAVTFGPLIDLVQ